MLRRQAYRFRLKTTPRIEAMFRVFAGHCRFVYNRALAINEERFAKGEKRLGFAAMCKELTKWKREECFAWLRDAPIHSLQQSLKNLERGYTNFFEGRADKPHFKKKGKSIDSFRFPDRFEVDSAQGRVKLPKVGWVRFFNSRPVEGTPKNVTVSRRAGKWYVSIQTEREVAAPVHPHSESAAGVDVGIVSLATLSTGEQIPPVNAFRGIQKRLRRLQRSMSRKVKFSANWKKAKEKVARIHSHAASRRNDHLHKTTTTICKNHAMIVVEDLNVQGMSRSAKGTVEAPGKNVKQKAGLNRSILDQGWSEMFRQLAYKCEWSGGKLVKVNPAYSSQTCHRCGLTEGANRPTQSRFDCLWCGWAGNADVNAAKVLLARGQRVTASGGASEVDGLKPPA
jgi:putative transposase